MVHSNTQTLRQRSKTRIGRVLAGVNGRVAVLIVLRSAAAGVDPRRLLCGDAPTLLNPSQPLLR